jgi:DNA-binding MarR family transcriptional regulator
MNRATTSAERALVALAATEALEAMAEMAARDLERHAAAFGLSDAKLEVLEVLGCCDDRRACLYALGDELRVTRPNVTKLVDGLEREGLVERLPHPRDRRMVQAHITGAGADVAERALPGRRERMERLWSRLSDEELADLVRLLRAALAPERERVPSGDAAVPGSR